MAQDHHHIRKGAALVFVLCACWSLLAACSSEPGDREFKLGERELKRGNYVRAVSLFQKSIERRPNDARNAEAFNHMGVAHWKLGKRQEAQDAFEDSRRLNPAFADPVYNLGVVLAEGGEAARGVRLLGEAAVLAPADTRALEYLGHLYAGRRQWPEARRSLYAALSRDPESARILTAIAAVEMEADSPERAVATLMKALEKNSRYAPALYNLGYIYHVRLGKERQAEAYFDKYLSADPDGPMAAQSLDYLQAIRGKSAPGGAVVPAEAEASATVKPGPAPVAAETARPAGAPAAESPADLLKQASSLSDRGQIQKALDLCLQVAGDARKAGDAALEEKALRHAVKVCFDQAQAHYELGNFLLKQKKADAALKSFKQALVLNNTYVPAQIGLAEAAIETGEMDAALIGLKDAVRGDPKNPDALFALAFLYDQHLGLPESAARSYREFASKFPADPRTAPSLKRAQELAPTRAAAVEPVEAVGSVTEPGVTASIPVAVVSAAPAETPAPPRAPARKLEYKKPATRNTRDAVQAFNRGSYYQDQKDWDRAIYYYLRSLENDDQLTSTLYNLGTAYTVKGDYDLAKDAYLRALELQPTLVNARYNLALVYKEQKDYSSARRLLEDVLKAKPDYATAHFAIAAIYAEDAATVNRAKQHYQRFVDLAPNDPSARWVRQWLNAH